jgi:hypothetical protein
MNDAVAKKKLLEPPRIREKGGEGSSFPFALNQKTVGPAKEAGLKYIVKEP